jgi:hypothetical protein
MFDDQTEYQIFNDSNPHDLTIKRMKIMLNEAPNRIQRITLVNAIKGYMKKKIAIAWRKGSPVYINIEC